jgi:hypothetical protein
MWCHKQKKVYRLLLVAMRGQHMKCGFEEKMKARRVGAMAKHGATSGIQQLSRCSVQNRKYVANMKTLFFCSGMASGYCSVGGPCLLGEQ